MRSLSVCSVQVKQMKVCQLGLKHENYDCVKPTSVALLLVSIAFLSGCRLCA